jgi:CHAT domain-containing protein
MLNLVNFAALPQPDGTYVVERGVVLHYLSTERDVLLRAPDTAAGGALLVGGATFDARSGRKPTSRTRGCDDVGRMLFSDLPGSAREAAEISELWKSAVSQDVLVLTGAQATETRLKELLSKRGRLMHLATHGFFLGTDCRSVAPGSRAVGGIVITAKRRVATSATENPLLLSGLAFAGANALRPLNGDDDDGIMTAEEIAGLNLEGTEWAVLSACDTGLGEIRSGEGVFGLRRAFQIAGARTVIMSLWSVDDEATRLWMRALYEGRLTRHLDTADSVREASLTVLKQRRAAGLSTHPFYWAAFVAAGDWR